RFSREINDSKGGVEEISFTLAFAGDLRSPDLFYFVCQKENVPDIDYNKLQRHKNGVKSIREIVLSESNPSDFQYLLQEVTGQRDQNAHSFGIELKSENVNIAVHSPVGMKAWFGAEMEQKERGLIGRAIVLGVRNLEKTREYFENNHINFHEIGNRLVVDPAPGQGVILAFEANK
ncbi:MAG: VOC family protein, partial [Rhizobiaceae bacterium]